MGLSENYHACGPNWNQGHSRDVNPRKVIQSNKAISKSWVQKYAELDLVEMGLSSPEVNVVPQMSTDSNFETISVTVDSGAFNTVGPPTVGTRFKITPH